MKYIFALILIETTVLIGCEGFLRSGEPAKGSSPSRTTAAPTKPRRNWDQLTPGMAPTQVRMILGAPDRTAKTRDGEVWYYGTNSVNFDGKNQVVDWVKR